MRKFAPSVRCCLVSIALLALCLGADCAQAQSGGGQSAAAAGPIPEGDVTALIKQEGLVESGKSAREMTPGGWVKPKMMLVAIDRPERLAWLQSAVPDVKLVGVYQRGTLAEKEAEVAPYIADADALVHVAPDVLCTANNIKAARKLKWIHDLEAGAEFCINLPEVKAGKFLFSDSQKLWSEGVADNTIAMMVALMRGTDLFVRMDMDQTIKQPAFGARGWQIEGRTLLVVGLGGIGTEVASMAHGLGMKVIATRNSSHDGPDYVDYVGLANELPDLIGKADVVAMEAPVTPETTGVFNAAMFARMKRGAIFIDVTRDEHWVKSDLIAALKSGQVGAAGLGITTPEGIPDHDPLFSAPNVIIETHGGAPAAPAEGTTDPTTDVKGWLVTRENMRRYANGEKMLSLVDTARGY